MSLCLLRNFHIFQWVRQALTKTWTHGKSCKSKHRDTFPKVHESLLYSQSTWFHEVDIQNRNDSWSPAAESRHDSTACVSLPRRTCNCSPLKDVSSSIFFRFKSSYNHLIQQVFMFFPGFYHTSCDPSLFSKRDTQKLTPPRNSQ